MDRVQASRRARADQREVAEIHGVTTRVIADRANEVCYPERRKHLQLTSAPSLDHEDWSSGQCCSDPVSEHLASDVEIGGRRKQPQ